LFPITLQHQQSASIKDVVITATTSYTLPTLYMLTAAASCYSCYYLLLPKTSNLNNISAAFTSPTVIATATNAANAVVHATDNWLLLLPKQ